MILVSLRRRLFEVQKVLFFVISSEDRFFEGGFEGEEIFESEIRPPCFLIDFDEPHDVTVPLPARFFQKRFPGKLQLAEPVANPDAKMRPKRENARTNG